MAGAPSHERRWWIEEEDSILRQEVEFQQIEGGVISWNTIAAKLPGRSNKDCRKRWHKIGSHIKKGVWTAEEDIQLQEAVGLLGLKWTQVSERVGTRNSDQCAKRWAYALNPSVSHAPWTEEQDESLLRAVHEFGRNWSKIGSAVFGDRSAVDIKNRYFVLQRKLQNNPSSNTQVSPADDESSSGLSLSDSGDQSGRGQADGETSFSIPDYALSPASLPLASDMLPTPMSDHPMPDPGFASLLESTDFNTNLHSTYENIMLADPMGNSSSDDFQAQHYYTTPEATDGNVNIEGAFNGLVETPMEADPARLPLAGTQVNRAQAGADSQSTLILEGLQPQTVTLILSTLLNSNTRFRMRINKE
ncbi:hypothetical protein FQN49_000871 [Arthroderma sp. PD_2]|nr:hypothetical protein FQN49_000871 [Arthroderma sp. PD_2]